MTSPTTRPETASPPPSANLDDLQTRARGPVLRPGDPRYDESRSVWNAMIDRRPAAVLRCLGTADVVAGIAFARANGMPLCVKGGGHNIAGLAVADGGLMLDLSMMRGVWVDPGERLARAQGGCLLGDVDRETQLHGLAAVLGFISNTGIAGLTLGGGFGYLTRRFGWTSDTLRAVDLVTADGRCVRATEQQHPDLFWALRGGGGNFGVATHFDYALHPVGPEIVAGAVAWPGEDAREVLDMAVATMRDAPPELTIVPVLRLAPPAPWLPKEIHGRPVAVTFVCHSGPVAEAERQVAALKAFGRPVGDVLVRRSYVSQQSLIDGTQPKGRRYYWKSEYLAGFTSELLDKMVTHAATIRSPHSALVLFPIDGALNRLPEAHSPVGNRGARVVINITAAWERADEDAAHIAWARDTWRDVRPLSTGGTYVNFLTEEEGDDRIRAAYGANFDRLAAIKATWDPDNVFRTNKNIAPRA